MKLNKIGSVLIVIGVFSIIVGLGFMMIRRARYPFTWENFWNPPRTYEEYKSRLEYYSPYLTEAIIFLTTGISIIVLGIVLGREEEKETAAVTRTLDRRHIEEIEHARFCRYCGRRISKEAEFCSYCGKPLN